MRNHRSPATVTATLQTNMPLDISGKAFARGRKPEPGNLPRLQFSTMADDGAGPSQQIGAHGQLKEISHEAHFYCLCHDLGIYRDGS